jgi:UDP-hydrolysing UDP-N-acetyl-D-glucosamine 2-epimerase
MKLGIVTVARSDFGIYEPLLKEVLKRSEIDLRLMVSGMHLAPEFGLTVRDIEKAGYPVAHRVEMMMSSDTPEGTAKSMGLGLMGFAQVFASDRPDWLVVLGDRFEMFSAVAAALPFRIPVAHLHGGELTFGAIDEAMRHSITKMSHLHFASTPEYAARICQMGEEPWRVFHSGALSLEDLSGGMPSEELERHFQVRLDPPPLLVTFHPVTLQYEAALAQLEELLAALDESRQPCVITLPNADASGRAIAARMMEFAEQRPDRVKAVGNFGRAGYFGMLQHASAMVGNSSSGIIEAGSFHLPAVNIGERQAGRVRGGNVLDAAPARKEILGAIWRATSSEFRAACREFVNPYEPPPGMCPSQMILERILSQPVGEHLLMKKFYQPRGGNG